MIFGWCGPGVKTPGVGVITLSFLGLYVGSEVGVGMTLSLYAVVVSRFVSLVAEQLISTTLKNCQSSKLRGIEWLEIRLTQVDLPNE